MTTPTRVWDLPTRVFHWTLALLVAGAFVTVKVGGAWMDWHPRCGYAILTLVIFRLLWGFAGSRYALFSTFVLPPWRALRADADTEYRGHTALGAYSVLAMLGALMLQATLGLFANDAIVFEGPWVKFVSSELSETLSTWHRRGQWLIGGLVLLHLAAIAWYAGIKREPLLGAMVSGDRAVTGPAIQDNASLRLRALLLFGSAAALTYWLVTL